MASKFFNTSDLMNTLFDHYQADITEEEAKKIVSVTVQSIKQAIHEGKAVELRDFGVFKQKLLDARVGRDPRNGKPIFLSERRGVLFKGSDISES